MGKVANPLKSQSSLGESQGHWRIKTLINKERQRGKKIPIHNWSWNPWESSGRKKELWGLLKKVSNEKRFVSVIVDKWRRKNNGCKKTGSLENSTMETHHLKCCPFSKRNLWNFVTSENWVSQNQRNFHQNNTKQTIFWSDEISGTQFFEWMNFQGDVFRLSSFRGTRFYCSRKLDDSLRGETWRKPWMCLHQAETSCKSH